MQVDHVLDESSSVSSGVAFQTVCASLAEHLASRTYFVGHYLTIADLAVAINFSLLASGTPSRSYLRTRILCAGSICAL